MGSSHQLYLLRQDVDGSFSLREFEGLSNRSYFQPKSYGQILAYWGSRSDISLYDISVPSPLFDLHLDGYDLLDFSRNHILLAKESDLEILTWTTTGYNSEGSVSFSPWFVLRAVDANNFLYLLLYSTSDEKDIYNLTEYFKIIKYNLPAQSNQEVITVHGLLTWIVADEDTMLVCDNDYLYIFDFGNDCYTRRQLCPDGGKLWRVSEPDPHDTSHVVFFVRKEDPGSAELWDVRENGSRWNIDIYAMDKSLTKVVYSDPYYFGLDIQGNLYQYKKDNKDDFYRQQLAVEGIGTNLQVQGGPEYLSGALSKHEIIEIDDMDRIPKQES